MGGTAVAQRRFNKRKKLAYVHLYSHITDESLRKMLADEAFNDGEHAWQIMKRECDEPITDLELEDMKRTVRDLTADVRIDSPLRAPGERRT